MPVKIWTRRGAAQVGTRGHDPVSQHQPARGPEIDIELQAGLLATLYNQQATTLIEIDMLRDGTADDDPRVTQASRRLQMIERRIDAEGRSWGLALNRRQRRLCRSGGGI